MYIRISAGQGPVECEDAVRRFYVSLRKEYPDHIDLVYKNPSKFNAGMYSSIIFYTDFDLSDEILGTVQWACKSRFRPDHRGRNWYINVSEVDLNDKNCNIIINEDELKYETILSDGPGSQNINKVETGVKLTHIPTGISVRATSMRSQDNNKQDAYERLLKILYARQLEKKLVNNTRNKPNNLTRRELPVRVYKGANFTRIH